MAITVAALQTALDAVQTAIDAEDWNGASAEVAKAKAIRAGLSTGSIENQSFDIPSIRDLSEIEQSITAAKVRANRVADRGRRFMRTRIRHGR